MESTGKYWIPVYNLLEDKINVIVASPKWVRAVKGNKDDTKDSKWIGNLFRLGLVPGSFIPPKPIRILREYTRYRYKLVSCKSSEKNRYQNSFTVCNIAHFCPATVRALKASQAMGATRHQYVESANPTVYTAGWHYDALAKSGSGYSLLGGFALPTVGGAWQIRQM